MDERLTAEDLAAIRQRMDKATPGAWGYWNHDPGDRNRHGVTLEEPFHHNATHFLRFEDSEFVAAARTDLPRLLAAYDALLTLVRRALPHLAFGVDESTPEVLALVRDMRAWVEAE